MEQNICEIFYIKRNIYKWPTSNKNLKFDTVINRLRSEHIKLTHGYLMAGEEPPKCLTCGTEWTIKHNSSRMSPS